MSKLLSASELKWIGQNMSDLDKYTSNNLKQCVLGVDLEYPEELCKLHNDYFITSDKTEIRR